ncbi:MAG: CsbD family protein [Acidimicrobiia bacterium]
MSGEMDKAKGKAKQALGDLTDDESLRTEGKVDETAGEAKNLVDKVKDKLTKD